MEQKGIQQNMGMQNDSVGFLPIRRITVDLAPMLEHEAVRIFSCYRIWMLEADEGEMLDAVWGAKKVGALLPTQLAISQRINKIVAKVMNILALPDLRCEQGFAIAYIVRSLLAMKLLYMVNKLKVLILEETGGKLNILQLAVPLGCA